MTFDPSRRMSIVLGEIMPDGKIINQELIQLPTRLSRKSGKIQINLNELKKIQEDRE